jgi:hypothetical protein
MTGLETGGPVAGKDLPSRLHQAIISSVRSHPIIAYYTYPLCPCKHNLIYDSTKFKTIGLEATNAEKLHTIPCVSNPVVSCDVEGLTHTTGRDGLSTTED